MPARAAILALAFLLAACGESVHKEAAAPAAMRMAAPAPMPMDQAVAAGAEPAAEAAAPRYLAERQFWVFELPEKAIEARWQAHIALCRQDCEVLQAGLSKSAHSPVSASLQLRVGRANAGKLLDAISGPEVTERRVEREDKTLQVVDVDARLKTLGDLRDRLRELLAKRAGSLKDILETERELARVQGELDAMAAQRKALANETEKILLHVDYRPEPSLGETGAMQPLMDAWRGAGRAFAESLAAALLFILQALPWLVIVVPVVWGVWKMLRRLAAWRRARKASA